MLRCGRATSGSPGIALGAATGRRGVNGLATRGWDHGGRRQVGAEDQDWSQAHTLSSCTDTASRISDTGRGSLS